MQRLLFCLLWTFLLPCVHTQTCQLCHDGSAVPNPNLSVEGPGGDVFTCADLEIQAANETADASCNRWLRYGVSCGCPIHPQACTLCPDGSPPDFALIADIDANSSQPCSRLEAVIGVYSPDQPVANCADWHRIGVRDCGCFKPGCDLCFDGSTVPDPDLFIDDAGLTCGEIQLAAALDEAQTTWTCDEYTEILGTQCGCPTPEPVETSCYLCEDQGPIPFPDILVDALNSCQELEERAAAETGERCRAFQATAGEYCKCSNTQASTGFCRICGNATLLPQPGLTALVTDEGIPISCARAELNSIGLSCEDLQNEMEEVCCASLRPPPTPVPPPPPPPPSNATTETDTPPMAPTLTSYAPVSVQAWLGLLIVAMLLF